MDTSKALARAPSVSRDGAFQQQRYVGRGMELSRSCPRCRRASAGSAAQSGCLLREGELGRRTGWRSTASWPCRESARLARGRARRCRRLQSTADERSRRRSAALAARVHPDEPMPSWRGVHLHVIRHRVRAASRCCAFGPSSGHRVPKLHRRTPRLLFLPSQALPIASARHVRCRQSPRPYAPPPRQQRIRVLERTAWWAAAPSAGTVPRVNDRAQASARVREFGLGEAAGRPELGRGGARRAFS